MDFNNEDEDEEYEDMDEDDYEEEDEEEEPLTLSTLALIKSFVESNINSNGKKQVRYYILIYGNILI